MMYTKCCTKLPMVFLLAGLFFINSNFAKAENSDELRKANEDLSRIRQEIEAKCTRLDSLAKGEKSVLVKIRSVEENIDLTGAFVRKLDRTSALLADEIALLSEKAESSVVELQKAQEYFYAHLEMLYKLNRGRPRLAFLLAGSLPEAVRTYHWSHALIEFDNNLVSAIRFLIADVQGQKSQLVENRAKMVQVRAERDREVRNLVQEKSRREKLLSQIRSEKTLQKEAITELEQEAAELEKVMESLRAARPKEEQLIPDSKTAFYRFKKRLPWPVRGRVSVSYGEVVHPIYKTKTYNSGIDISAAYGAQVNATADGRVAYIGQLRGYGNFLIIDHDEGYYTLYARLSEVAVELDQQVLKGQKVGEIGDAGQGNDAGLHFEIRRGKSDYNPLEWLE